MKKFIFRIILILLENELLYNFEEFSSQFRSKQLFSRMLTGWFSVCIHLCDAFSDLITFASLKKTSKSPVKERYF